MYTSNAATSLHARSVETVGQQRCVPRLADLLHSVNVVGFHKQRTVQALFWLETLRLLTVNKENNNGAPCCCSILGGINAT